MPTSKKATRNSRFVAVFIFAFLAINSSLASTLIAVTVRANLPATETLDWAGFGPPDTDLTSGSSLVTSSGLVVTVSQPYYGLQVRQEVPPSIPNGGFYGDFLPGQTVLTNWNSPFAVTLSFSQPIFGAGLQVEPAQVDQKNAPFTAYVTAYDGTVVIAQFSTDGILSRSHDGSTPFLGVKSDTADITSLTYRVVVHTNGTQEGDLGMNFLSLDTSAPVPEPSTIALLGTAVSVLVRKRRRFKYR